MATKSTATPHYIPGVCNINPIEIRKRRMVGHLGLAVTIILIALAFALHVSWIFRIVIIIPAFLSVTGYLQAHNKFCVGFAAQKQQNADTGEIVQITDKDALELDKRKTRTMNLQATIIAAAVTAIVCVIPF
jgi:hypothetical protein